MVYRLLYYSSSHDDAQCTILYIIIRKYTCFFSSSWEAMLSAEALTALDDDGRTAVEEGDEVTPHALLVRTLEGATTNPCAFPFPFPVGVRGFGCCGGIGVGEGGWIVCNYRRRGGYDTGEEGRRGGGRGKRSTGR